MLAGLGALAIPVLIHLLLKRKKQRLRFSTLQFFRRHDEHSSQRRKLRNLLLLAVRLLLLAVLVLAFARPYLPDIQPNGTRQQRRLAVLVVDRSASMQGSDAGVPRWPRAREAIQKILSDLTANDRAALISCATHCEVLLGAAPPEAIGLRVKELQPTSGSGRLAEGLQLATKIISSAGAGSVSTIYFISDLQLNACKDLAAHPIPPNVEVKPITVGDILTPNVAVEDLQLDYRNGDRPHVVIASYSDEKPKAAKVNVLIDGKQVMFTTVDFATGNVARAELQLPALPPGWHSGSVRLDGADALALDNVRYEAFFVPQPLRTLLMETRQGKRIFEEESFFITSALDPMRGQTNSSSVSRFAIDKASPEEFLKKLTGHSERTNIDLIIMPGLKRIQPGLAGALSEFVRTGGALHLFLNDDVNPSRYNNEFRDLLPAQLGQLERNTAESADLKWHVEEYDSKAPVFAAFRRPGSGNLALPEFTRRCTLTANPSSIVSAKFGDGVPVIATTSLGLGYVALVNTSADTAWTDWPKHKTFVPWLHSLCFYLTARAVANQTRTAAHLIAAEDQDIYLGPALKNQTVRVERPGEKEVSAQANDDGRLLNLDFSAPAIYSIRNSEGQELQRVAANVPAEESDLTALTIADFQREITRTPEAHSTLAAGLFGSEDQHAELARLLLALGLVLLVGESFLANRTYA